MSAFDAASTGRTPRLPPSTPAVLALCACLALAFLGVGCAQLVDGLRSHAPPAGTQSARRLAPGPFEIVRQELRFVDASRATPPNNDFPGASSRSLPVTLWRPDGASGARPLVVYAHGFTGNRHEMAYLLEHLASYGYAVAALDFPLTHGDAPGGPTPRDLARQPGDVRFLIDGLLGLGSDDQPADVPVAAQLDPGRIALVGLSYGGLTTTLAAFHPEECEPRLAAAISIAGPAQMFDPRFFASGPPFLMVAGTGDGLVPYARNAAILPELARAATLVTLEAGTHLGFTAFAGRWLRFSHNPDASVCEALREDADAGELEDPFDPAAGPDPFAALGGPELGIDFSAWTLPCADEALGPARAMRPQRQHQLTRLAVRAFLDSVLASLPAERLAAARYLAQVMPAELPDLRLRRPSTAVDR